MLARSIAPVVLHPVGPRPPQVYWRRRVVVLAGLAVLVALIAWGCSSAGGSGAPAADRSPAAAGSPARPAPTTAPLRSTPAGTPSPTPTASTALAGCDPAALAVSAATDRDAYAAGEYPRFTMTVRNTGPAACTADVGRAAQEFLVYSGDDRVWAQDDCYPGGPAGPVALQPGKDTAVTISWGRHRSAPGCPSGGPSAAAALPGTYRLIARLGQVDSAPAVFHLTG